MSPIFSRLTIYSFTTLFAVATLAAGCGDVDEIDSQRSLLLTGTATASSLEGNSFPASNAVDGNMSTRWSSAFADPQWLRVDLGSTKAIGRVTIYWENAYGKDYQIQVSNDATTWTTIKSVTNGDGKTDDLTGLSGSGRYVRMYGTRRATQYGYSIFELQISPPTSTMTGAGGASGTAGAAGTTGSAGTGGASGAGSASGAGGASGTGGAGGTTGTGGASGTTGTGGASGTTGTGGASGTTGTGGASGTTGAGGASGTTGAGGASGTTGAGGAGGTTGAGGASGTTGAGGAGGTTGTAGASGTTGAGGASGTTGAGGASGTTGAGGASGTTGTAGTGAAGTTAPGAAIPAIGATASSVETGGTLVAKNAIDGNMSTRWSSGFSDPQWLTVDLGATNAIGRVLINWEAAYGKAYQIQVSDDNSTWTTIKSVTNGDGGTDDLTGLAGSGRYVRMYGTSRATQYGYSIFEIKVYAAGLPVGGGSTSLGRSDTLIDTSWKFNRADVGGASATTFNDGAWSSVTLPHTWNALDGQDGGSNYYRGIGWYRRHFTVPADSTGRRVFLQFDASNIVTDVYVNGTSVGEHRGGFAAFRYDVTANVVPGDNVVAVKVSNASVSDVAPLTADFTFYGGIYRDVHLVILDSLHVDAQDFGSSGVYLTPTSVTAASSGLTARVRVTNDGTVNEAANVSVIIRDASAATVATLAGSQTVAPGATVDVTMTATVANPHLWNGRVDPYLYSADVTVGRGSLVTDTDSEAFGFRFVSVSPSHGFSLNGAYLDLHGPNRHQDRLDKGWAIGKAEHDQDMALITEMGSTAVRTAHYQQADYFYDLCDSNGVVAWVEIPLVNNVTSSAAFNSNAQQQLKELIRQNYNHPSIVFWSLSNELSPSPDPNPLLSTLQTLAKAEDPSRLTTLASNRGDDDPINAHTDVMAFNKYWGWYSGTYDDFAPWADQVHANYPTRNIGISEFGAGAGELIHSETPVVLDHSEEYQLLFHETYWQAMNTRKFLWGKFIWNMFDFAVDSRNEGETPGRNDKGMVTYDRALKKDVFYYYKANWSTAPVLYITSRRFTTRTPAAITVKVYANTDDVTLNVNGASLGAQTSSNHIFTWTGVALQAGANVVQASGSKAGTGYSDSVTWMH